MLQTRAEAGALVLQLQRTAVAQGVLFGAIAAVAGMAFTTAAIVWIAVVVPPEWRGWALGITALALLGATYFAAVTAGKRLRRDAGLIADFTRGLKLDLAMVNLALKDPDAEDAEEVAKRERAKQAVREAAMAKATAPSTAEGGGAPAADGPSLGSVAAAMRAAEPIGPAAATTTGAGGAYASSRADTAANEASVAESVEREMPDALLGTAGAQTAHARADAPDQNEDDAARRRRHGSA